MPTTILDVLTYILVLNLTDNSHFYSKQKCKAFHLDIIEAVLVGVVGGALHVEVVECQPEIFPVRSGEEPLTVEILLVISVPIDVQALEGFTLTTVHLNSSTTSLSTAVGESNSCSEPEIKVQ